jgi:hypothetical protein
MRLSEIDAALRPENLPPQDALRSFHRALQHRRYYLMFSLSGPLLLPMLNVCSKLISKRLNNEHPELAIIPLVILMLYANTVRATISLFNFGTQNRFDPLHNDDIPAIEARWALRVLVRKVPGIYENNLFKILTESPIYAKRRQKLETGIVSIDDSIAYTPLKLAKELGAQNILDLFDRIAAEEHVIYLLLRASVSRDGNLSCLGRHSMLNILLFFAGSKVSELKAKASVTELRAIFEFAETHSKRQRDRLPKLLSYFESKVARSTSIGHEVPSRQSINLQLTL